MPKSKNRKDQKARSRNRTQRILQEKKSLEKKQKEMIMKFLEEQKNKEMFSNLPNINQEPQIDLNGPTI